MYVCIYVCMYVRMYIYIYSQSNIYLHTLVKIPSKAKLQQVMTSTLTSYFNSD